MLSTLEEAATIPAMNEDTLASVRLIESELMERPQVPVHTHHVLHGGVYTRSMNMPKGCVLTGALIKIPTTLIISGCVSIATGDDTLQFEGYSVVPALAGRKQVMYANEDSHLTMLFPTAAETVKDAEIEFTDEYTMLGSHKANGDTTVITGVKL